LRIKEPPASAATASRQKWLKETGWRHFRTSWGNHLLSRWERSDPLSV